MKKLFQRFRKSSAFAGFILFAIALLLNIVIQGPASFFSVKSINTLFAKNIPFILVCISQSFLLISGTMDISCGIQLALVNVVTIMSYQEWGIPFTVSCVRSRPAFRRRGLSCVLVLLLGDSFACTACKLCADLCDQGRERFDYGRSAGKSTESVLQSL